MRRRNGTCACALRKNCRHHGPMLTTLKCPKKSNPPNGLKNGWSHGNPRPSPLLLVHAAPTASRFTSTPPLGTRFYRRVVLCGGMPQVTDSLTESAKTPLRTTGRSRRGLPKRISAISWVQGCSSSECSAARCRKLVNAEQYLAPKGLRQDGLLIHGV